MRCALVRPHFLSSFHLSIPYSLTDHRPPRSDVGYEGASILTCDVDGVGAYETGQLDGTDLQCIDKQVLWGRDTLVRSFGEVMCGVHVAPLTPQPSHTFGQATCSGDEQIAGPGSCICMQGYFGRPTFRDNDEWDNPCSTAAVA